MNSKNLLQCDEVEHCGATILVADDDPITRRLLKRFLEEKGYVVLLANDGEQAWAQYLEHQPNLVVTDWRMPKLGGLELCKRIRNHRESHYTFILILTANADRDAMVQGFAAGADDFMTKPFDQAELTWRIYSGMRVIQLQADLQTRVKELSDTRSRLEDVYAEMRDGVLAAAKIQRELLPPQPPEVQFVNSAWIFKPSEYLGGDLLNLFKLTDARLGFFIADVCGHGLPAALLAVSLHKVMTPVTNHPGLLTGDNEASTALFSDPGRVLTEVNRRFPMNIENGEYFTAMYGVIDTEKRELRYAGAGHPHPIFVSKQGEVQRPQTEGFPVGFDDQTVYETNVISMQPGDRLFIYSDGVIETTNRDGEMYGAERLIQQIRDLGDQPIGNVVRELVVNVDQYQGAQNLQDDITLVALEFQADEDHAHAKDSCHEGVSLSVS